MKFRLLAAIIPAFLATQALAYEVWNFKVEKDPFEGADRVTVSYFQSERSGVVILCRPDEGGLHFRMLPGWRFDGGDTEKYDHAIMSKFAIAVDGKVLDVTPTKSRFGNIDDNLANADVHIDHDSARNVVEAWINAKSQIALKDGVSDSPFLLTARGSTNSGRALEGCLDNQS